MSDDRDSLLDLLKRRPRLGDTERYSLQWVRPAWLPRGREVWRRQVVTVQIGETMVRGWEWRGQN